MSRPLLSRLLIWMFAGNALLGAHVASAESHSPVPPLTEEGETANDAAASGDKPAAGDKKPARVATRERSAKKPVAAAKRRANRQPTAEYQRMRDGWHAPVMPDRARVAELPAHRPLVIAPVNSGERVSIVPQRDDGGFSEADLLLAARAFAPQGRKKLHPVSPHLVDLIYRTMMHFDATLVHLISGFRPDRAGSRHTQGRAIDMVIPGVTNEELADYLRTLGFVGVGVYPKSGFVHLDVRETSYFWLDNSLPDERCRAEPMLPELAKQADRAARARGEAPNAYVPNNDREDKAAVRAYHKRALRKRAAAEARAVAVTQVAPSR